MNEVPHPGFDKPEEYETFTTTNRLEEEIQSVVENYNKLVNGSKVMKPSGIEKIARHFYELGLKHGKKKS